MPSKKNIQVLVIDDDESLLEMLSMMLKRIGYEVKLARSGEEGIEVFVGGDFDIVLCDNVMPSMNGGEVLKKLMKIDENVLFLMMTGHPTIESAVSTMAEGAFDYISKPFSVKALEFRIHKAMEAKRAFKKAKTLKVVGIIMALCIPFWIGLGLWLAAIFFR